MYWIIHRKLLSNPDKNQFGKFAAADQALFKRACLEHAPMQVLGSVFDWTVVLDPSWSLNCAYRVDPDWQGYSQIEVVEDLNDPGTVRALKNPYNVELRWHGETWKRMFIKAVEAGAKWDCHTRSSPCWRGANTRIKEFLSGAGEGGLDNYYYIEDDWRPPERSKDVRGMNTLIEVVEDLNNPDTLRALQNPQRLPKGRFGISWRRMFVAAVRMGALMDFRPEVRTSWRSLRGTVDDVRTVETWLRDFEGYGYLNYVYLIHPDWSLKPSVASAAPTIDMPVELRWGHYLVFNWPGEVSDATFGIHCAASSTKFVGYVYANDDCQRTLDVREAKPVAVRFWK